MRHQGRYRRQAAAAALSRTEWEIAGQELAFAVNAIRGFDGLLYRQGKLEVTEDFLLRARIAAHSTDRAFFLAGPPSAAFRQIGNAVPPLLGRRLGEAMLACARAERRQQVSTTLVSGELAAWYHDHGAVRVRVHRTEDPFEHVLAEQLWRR